MISTSTSPEIQQLVSMPDSIPLCWKVPMQVRMFLHDRNFRLTGSRYFNPNSVTEKTDWDFFCQTSVVMEQQLKSLGFVDLRKYDYKEVDKGLVTVLRYQHEDVQIDVQLCNDVEERLMVREALKKVDWLSIPKEERGKVWNTAYQLLSLPYAAASVLKGLL